METEAAAGRSGGKVDWIQVRRRLEHVQAILEQQRMRGPEERKRILQARAAVLARGQPDQLEQEQLEVLEFLLAYERYGIASAHVLEVCPLKEITALANTPPFVVGIVNVRGRIVSVVDLKKFFDLPEKGLTDLNKLILISNGDLEFGLLADAVVEVRPIPRPEIQPALPTQTGVRHDYMQGITRDGLVILDVSKLLADPRMIVRQESSG